MHVVVFGLFKPGADVEAGRLPMEFNEHLAQRHIRVAGPLLDARGEPRGWLGILDSESLHAAQAFLDRSPYFKAASTSGPRCSNSRSRSGGSTRVGDAQATFS